MALPTGTITMEDVNVELSKAPTAQITLNDADVRDLAEKPTGTISMDDLRGKSAVPSGPALAWGRNSFGQLGTGTTINQSSPVTVVGGITNWAQVSGGYSHSLGVTSTGIAYAWGNGAYGRLGDGTNFIARSSPVTVTGGITNWTQVSAGREHNLGVTNSGIAYAWGRGGSGRLGDGTNFIARSSPVTVTGGITNWTQVSAGREHSLGVTNSGIAYAWGNGGSGRLGDGTTTYQLSPVTVVGGITNWAQVSAGDFHSLGVTDSGIAYAWGQNDFFGPIGQLGTGTTINQSSPVTVVGGITNWAQVSAGSFHSLGVTDDGIAYAWGAGESGRLGTGTTTYQSSPVTVIGGITNWAQVSGGQHSLGITDTGIAYAWGQGNYGRLGTSDIISRSSPVTVVGGITNWLQADSGDLQHMVAIREQ